MNDELDLAETWSWREYPLLREVVRVCDEHPRAMISIERVLERLPDLPRRDAERGLLALASAGYFSTHANGGQLVSSVLKLHPAARREVGTWPGSDDMAADRLLAALTALAKRAPDEPTRTRARGALEQFAGFSRDTLAAIAATVITGQIPGAGT